MSVLPTLIRAKDTADLLKQVREQLEAGRDLYSPLFASEYGYLCQWMVKSPTVYEYRLVDVESLTDLELQVGDLAELGFELMFNTVLWQGRYLQWMSKWNNFGQAVKEAVTLINAERSEELQLVEDVRAVLKLVPVSPVGYALAIPFMTERDVVKLGERYLNIYGTNIPDILLVDGVPLR
jgi:hypothetical protein